MNLLKLCLLAIYLLGGVQAWGEPRGFRNNNFGNLRAKDAESFKHWPGGIGVDADSYLVFKRPIDGLRAIVINLKAYGSKHKIRTVRKVVRRWVKDQTDEREVWAYVDFVAKHLRVHPDNRINLSNPATLKKLTQAIVKYENGQDLPEKLYRRVFPNV